ncbi:DUF2460 domain-containing protein [Qipengyuania xiapuensis]|uniref:DUF2460 domain-containing protein n=1 Tax=Qipengyuania xiapuensis TaxID=2867236 RepID=A0ABX8ZVW3_9SPHN|nr:DUF2460 domain-containing protein [Qipengyuania xiapuensis]QZD91732.1 DUF2460 domain-containing protein [Qipengyuania xiapuensis]
MAFWLASERRRQQSDWIQRFDPRFWTVNFPRPMMASVVTTAHDAMRLDLDFYHEGELAGLIWDSEDTLDHPLLAYETRKDYAHCILRFRWKSSGLVALDQPHGPTLTIEGRDASGTPRSWYVRLWNYAEGTPTEASIELPFSKLQSGYTLPGEAIHAGDIDRMFISLAPVGYVEGSSNRLPARRSGWAELTGISCEGEVAMLEIGDVMIPAHGEQMATAYDDAFNQTPARLLRQVEQLGYRGRIVHYVGMSHYYRLEDNMTRVRYGGELCEPARKWHADFFARAVDMGFAPIASLSYELLAQDCPDWWQQRDWNWNYGRTGWDPPSALLSPLSVPAMQFLRSIAAQFVTVMEDAGAEVLFQIGEPWWWIQPDTGAPCIFDYSARQFWGSDIVAITDMRAPMNDAQKALLDRAGQALSDSTDALAQAVRDAATGAAEVMLLAFTPTVLDPQMPELYRANLPVGWAYPAFDRLQLEDYDWLIQGADALRRQALEFVDERLGYPTASQDYLAGFVLDPDDAHTFWPRIDRALDEARERGVEHRFVWALPQVSRDGYTRLPTYEEDEVSPFDDVTYPLSLGTNASASPEFSTSVAVTASGHERRNALWSDARMRYDVGPGVRSQSELRVLLGFFRARFGPARGFRLRDPHDFSSNGGAGEPTAGDEIIGHGDGLSADFQLRRNYGEQRRPITRPEEGSILVSIDGVPASGWTHVGKGLIRFDAPPPAGAEIRAGFRFDVPVRFAEDRLDISGATFAAGEAPSVPLVEIREAS